MTDVMTPEQRSRCMAAVKGKDTKPEMIVRKYLFSKGLRYRLYNKKLHGSPDMVLKKYKTVIFIDGCFLQGHDGCKYFKMPKSNEFFWEQRFGETKPGTYPMTMFSKLKAGMSSASGNVR